MITTDTGGNRAILSGPARRRRTTGVVRPWVPNSFADSPDGPLNAFVTVIWTIKNRGPVTYYYGSYPNQTDAQYQDWLGKITTTWPSKLLGGVLYNAAIRAQRAL
jgi:hypothetical protein